MIDEIKINQISRYEQERWTIRDNPIGDTGEYWRIVGENNWRKNKDEIRALTPGTYQIESFDGQIKSIEIQKDQTTDVIINRPERKNLLFTANPTSELLYAIDIDDMIIHDTIRTSIIGQDRTYEILCDSGYVYYANHSMWGGWGLANQTIIGKLDPVTMRHVWSINALDLGYSNGGVGGVTSSRIAINNDANSIYRFGRLKIGETYTGFEGCEEFFHEFDLNTSEVKREIFYPNEPYKIRSHYNHWMLNENGNPIGLSWRYVSGTSNDEITSIKMRNFNTGQELSVLEDTRSPYCQFAGISSTGEIIILIQRYSPSGSNSSSYLKLIKVSNMSIISTTTLLESIPPVYSIPDNHNHGRHQLIGNNVFYIVNTYGPNAEIRCRNIHTGDYVFPHLLIPNTGTRQPTRYALAAHKYQNKLYVCGRLVCGENWKIAEIEYNETAMQYTGRYVDIPKTYKYNPDATRSGQVAFMDISYK